MDYFKIVDEIRVKSSEGEKIVLDALAQREDIGVILESNYLESKITVLEKYKHKEKME